MLDGLEAENTSSTETNPVPGATSLYIVSIDLSYFFLSISNIHACSLYLSCLPVYPITGVLYSFKKSNLWLVLASTICRCKTTF